jgi:DNA-binding response OmpR family regulator
MKTILIVDDDKEIANLVSIYMLNEGFKILQAYNGEQALIALEENAVSLIILDVMMPGIDGMEVCRK